MDKSTKMVLPHKEPTPNPPKNWYPSTNHILHPEYWHQHTNTIYIQQQLQHKTQFTKHHTKQQLRNIFQKEHQIQQIIPNNSIPTEIKIHEQHITCIHHAYISKQNSNQIKTYPINQSQNISQLPHPLIQVIRNYKTHTIQENTHINNTTYGKRWITKNTFNLRIHDTNNNKQNPHHRREQMPKNASPIITILGVIQALTLTMWIIMLENIYKQTFQEYIVYIDNKTTIHNINTPPHQKHKMHYYNIFTQIYANLKQIKTKGTWKWIISHQIIENNPQKLNHTADRITNEQHTKPTQPPPPHDFPQTQDQLHINDETIHSHIYSKNTQQCQHNDLQLFIQQKWGWSSTQFKQINWNAFNATSKSSSTTKSTFLRKSTIRWIDTLNRPTHDLPTHSPTCPQCNN